MRFTTAQNFTSLRELLRFYGDADEIVLKTHSELDEPEIAELCREARRLAHHLKLHHGTKSAAQIAETLGFALLWESLQIAEGKVWYFAECSLRPPQITLNLESINSLAKLTRNWAGEDDRAYFSALRIEEVAVAHELYHLIAQQPVSPVAELSAHVFARSMTSLPFSPLLYEVLLARFLKGEGPAGR